MEKAHPDVFNILLQLMDDGRLTDAKGNVVNFRNCIVIFTSNIGSQQLLTLALNDEHATPEEIQNRHEKVQQKVMAELKVRFRPEFLNRIDEFVTFNSLGKEQLLSIVGLEVNKVRNRLSDRKIGFGITTGAQNWLTNKGFDVQFGARPLKRTIQREVETPISKIILGGSVKAGDYIQVELPATSKHSNSATDPLAFNVIKSTTAIVNE